MSEPGYVVMPIQGSSGRNISNQDTSDAVSTMKQSLNKGSTLQSSQDYQGFGNQSLGNQDLGSRGFTGTSHGSRGLDNQVLPGIDSRSSRGYQTQQHAGPLKKVIANQDSLYKYLNWEDPLRTIASYFGVLSILFGLHYFPLTQVALKGAATVLGIMSIATFAGQSFNPKSNTRSQVKQYKTVPEETLNATLRDIHDFIQYAVIEAQRIAFGEDLTKTFASFVGVTILYWLIKILPAFWLSVVVVTSLYGGTLVLSPRGLAVAQEAGARAGEHANTAAESGKQLAQDGKKQASRLSSQAQDAATDASRRTGNALQSGKQTVNQQANRAVGAASNAAGRTSDAVQSGKVTVVDQASRATGSSGRTSNSTGLPQTNNNAVVREIDATRSNLNSTHHQSNTNDSQFSGATSTSIGNTGLGSTSSGLETPLETPGVMGDAAAARAYMSNSASVDPMEYTHIPDYGAVGGSYNGHGTVNTESANRLNTTHSPLDATNQAPSTPRYSNIDGNFDTRFDSGGPDSTGTTSRTYTNTANSSNF